jgi:hypothetical protein
VHHKTGLSGKESPRTLPRWWTETVGDSDLSLTVLGLLAGRELAYEEPYELALPT